MIGPQPGRAPVDVATGRLLAEVHPEMGVLEAAAFLPDGKTVAAGGDGGAKLFDIVTSQQQTTLRERAALRGRSVDMAVSPHGEWLATAGGATVKLWNVLLGKNGLPSYTRRQIRWPFLPTVRHRPPGDAQT